ncbi:MAG: cellulase family glycosylhydrolase [Anaerolineae bacterium]|nr:cellulase family glycosylhydrolase [Anaerolineae bacterium]
MKRNLPPLRRKILMGWALVLLLAGTLWLTRNQLQTVLFNLTGEETLLPQISGTIQYFLTRLQPPLKTADDVPVQYANVNPYGVNTFLQTEVEPAKREEAMRLISEAGIKWIRQEFTWEDIEIHGKGDFEDRRHEPYQSAWAKYDHIVNLADKYDLKIMARLSNPPAWTRALTDTVGTFAPPDHLSDYGDFVEAVVTRYRGRIPAYQIWNEPNIYPEWGEYPISAEEYTQLLKEGYTRVKAVDADAIVVMGALAATIELDRVRRYDANGWPTSPGGLSDVLFLQQMYDAGATPYFDVLAMQGYGLWSGPTDRRMQPRVLNFSRPLYIREVMVRNGDAHKPIWLSELGWNAVPPESNIPPVYGQVSLEQQARYAALAYQRMQKEWPWVGVGFYWFFKQADEREKESNPQYYFRMVEPDFTPLPVYDKIKEQTRQVPMMYQGWHQADHWTVNYQGGWQPSPHDAATFGTALAGRPGDTATFSFVGSRLDVVLLGSGRLRMQVDDTGPVEVDLSNATGALSINLVNTLISRSHRVNLEVIEGPVWIDGYVVHSQSGITSLGGMLMGLIILAAGILIIWRRYATRRP